MTAVEDAIEAAVTILNPDRRSLRDAERRNLTAIIGSAVGRAIESKSVIAADDTEGLRAALLRIGALEQVGWQHDWKQAPKLLPTLHAMYEHGGECPDCVPVYRFKGEQP